MNLLRPIYTEKRECQDCYKCVRNCPVKAIKVENGCATVIADLCILCGRCVSACPNGAKRVRDDLPRARQLLTLRNKVVVSLAPSYAAEFTEGRPAQLIRALKQLGFWAVSETALGAQQVSAHVARALRERPDRPLISSACPSAVGLVAKYHPRQAEFISALESPVLAHCRLLRYHYGEDVGVVFIGPCIAKKVEADHNPELLNVVLTFEDLRAWFEQAKISWSDLEDRPEDRFFPEPAQEGALYPVDGGMIAGIRSDCGVHDPAFMSFSGIGSIERGLAGIEDLHPKSGLFLELLACEGGCVGGPKTRCDVGTARKRYHVLTGATYPSRRIPRKPDLEIAAAIPYGPASAAVYSEAQVRHALQAVGKFSFEDERNCGGCGYETCRAFGHALLDGKAERAMCVTYMRQLALKKANALLRTMPSAVAIVDRNLTLLECNETFVRMFAPDVDPKAAVRLDEPRMQRLVPFPNLFQSVLNTGEDILEKDLRYRNTILHGSIFSIEKQNVVGGVFQDVTRPAVQKEQIVRKAREVIQKNLATVQQIAYLLGENAAESEITLHSIIESFSPRVEEDPAALPGVPGPAGEDEQEHDDRDDDRHNWKRSY
jgi:iron only hydrogenase large subunit-like protein